MCPPLLLWPQSKYRTILALRNKSSLLQPSAPAPPTVNCWSSLSPLRNLPFADSLWTSVKYCVPDSVSCRLAYCVSDPPRGLPFMLENIWYSSGFERNGEKSCYKPSGADSVWVSLPSLLGEILGVRFCQEPVWCTKWLYCFAFLQGICKSQFVCLSPELSQGCICVRESVKGTHTYTHTRTCGHVENEWLWDSMSCASASHCGFILYSSNLLRFSMINIFSSVYLAITF